MGIFSADLFPTKLSVVIFLSYMGLFINQGILVTASKTSTNQYKYSTVTVVLLTECIKLLTAMILYLKDHSFPTMMADINKYKTVMLFYFVPAFLYCLYNNLQFVNLAVFDPTTYYLLLQIRVVVTGIIFQILFKKKLSAVQWVSVLMLTVGCIIKDINRHMQHTTKPGAETKEVSISSFFDIHLGLIMVQVFASCFAGVYNEYLLKDKGCDVHIMMQNIFMYVDSIFCNVIVLGFRGELIGAFTIDNVTSLGKPIVIAIMFNNAAIGITTSLFLRNMNSILKTFASALELMFTAVLCWFIFGIAIDVYTVVAIFVVSIAVYIYSQNPVVNKPKNELTLSPVLMKENGSVKETV
ncbi:UDP-galactose transporter senju-like [Gigantopelta aegis]|uniref:UDP-galactose transporter senju-like n=1 Tax=Gigantopelta aegis TaxID=1735272 RepID=UPI001B88AA26|nr:UDP-galactose transporter senju-like [Gigantopelta aegis]